MKYKITLEVESDKKIKTIESTIKYSVGEYIKINKLNIEEIK